jgi:ParB/RepB/Spo0J family partition protein
MTAQCLNIAVDRLHVARHHHRTSWGDLVGLSESICAVGMLAPLVVRVLTENDFEIIAGVRRLRAAVMGGKTEVPCLVVEADDITAVIMQAEENLKRADLHPIDEALYCAELSTRGFDPGEIAAKLGLPRRRVVRRMALLALSPVTRAAYVANLFDEDAALALARVDETQQARIVSSLEASSLQPEEIPAYVSRIFTANLDDVPWRVTDERVLPAAGPCSTCQKRSDVQRDLFPETVTRLRCLDVDCYRGKMDATYAIVLKTHSPLRILDQMPRDVFLAMPPGRPVVIASSGLIDSESPCKLIEGRTWGEAVSIAATAQAAEAGANAMDLRWLTRDQDGRPRYLLKEVEAMKLVKGSDAAADAKDARLAADPTPAETNRAKAKVRRALLAKVADLAVTGDNDTWCWVVERMIADAAPRTAALSATALAGLIGSVAGGGAEGKDALVALARASNRGARRVAAALTVFADDLDDSALDELARLCGSTLATVTAGITE